VLFGVLVAGAVVAVSLLFFGLFFIQALGVLGLIAAAGLLHYWLWGAALARRVELEEPARPADDDGLPAPWHQRRF
jgi:hypothetical protein